MTQSIDALVTQLIFAKKELDGYAKFYNDALNEWNSELTARGINQSPIQPIQALKPIHREVKKATTITTTVAASSTPKDLNVLANTMMQALSNYNSAITAHQTARAAHQAALKAAGAI
jgi:hypothetical protein